MPQPFLDISFPPYVARGATGGPTFSTNVVTLASGAEQRNVLWANARGRWNISTGIRTRAQMLEVIAFFYIVKGRGYSFRFRDWNDYQATDVPMVEVSSTCGSSSSATRSRASSTCAPSPSPCPAPSWSR